MSGIIIIEAISLKKEWLIVGDAFELILNSN